MAVASYNVTFLKKEKVSSDAYKFHFKKPKSFIFTAGQYLKMKLEIKSPDNRGVTRYFTISSSPTEKDLFIITKIGKSTFKQALNSLNPGDKVQIRGQWGDFVLPESNSKKLVFLAGGIGLTPFRSIFKYISDKKLSLQVFMINSYSDEMAAKLSLVMEEFKNLPGFRLQIMLERITTQFLQKELDLNGSNIYYISGPEKMVADLAKDLQKLGVSSENIKTDDFPGYS